MQFTQSSGSILDGRQRASRREHPEDRRDDNSIGLTGSQFREHRGKQLQPLEGESANTCYRPDLAPDIPAPRLARAAATQETSDVGNSRLLTKAVCSGVLTGPDSKDVCIGEKRHR